jgi:NADPH:quinone reductase
VAISAEGPPGSAAGAAPMPLRGTRVHNVWIRADGPQLAELAELVDARRLTPRVAATLLLEEVAAAHQRVTAGVSAAGSCCS